MIFSIDISVKYGFMNMQNITSGKMKINQFKPVFVLFLFLCFIILLQIK